MGANTLGLLFFSISIAFINQCNAGSMKVDGMFKMETKDEDISLIGKIYAHRKEPVIPALPSDKCPEGLRGPPGDKGDQGRGREGPRGIPGDDGDPGDKGEAGEPGYCAPDCSETSRGEKGDQGEKGVHGTPGFPGRAGSEGDRGRPGEPGEVGDIGAPGTPGLPGDKGEQGPTGYSGYKGQTGDVGFDGYSIKGAMGQKGDMGLPGPQGLPGIPGVPCDCANDDSEEADEVLCTKNPLYSESGYYVHNSKDEFKAYCNMTTKTACISSAKNTTKPINYSGILMSYWLSMVDDDYTVQDIYGISKNNIEWLQKKSTSVSLTLRYHCLNSKPNPIDSTKALKLLTWNDVVIGPTPTDTTPFYYSIPSETDGCQESGESEWRYTDIVLSTNFVKRLPIKDYFISDIRDDEEQSFYIELISLCFK